MYVTGSYDPYVEIKLGNYRCTTHHFENNTNTKCNQVSAFLKERIQSYDIIVIVKDDFIGQVVFDLNEVPKRERGKPTTVVSFNSSPQIDFLRAF